MRMSRRIGIYSSAMGASTATVLVYGALSETVTLTHVDGTAFTVTTNANGASSAIKIPIGTYSVVGSVSNQAVSSRTVTVDANTKVVTAYPPGAIFWFGNGDTDGDTLWNKCGGWTPISGAYPAGQGRTGAAWSTYAYGQASGTDGWYTFANHARSSSQYGATSRITNLIDYTGYTTAKALVTSYIQNSGKSGIGLCASGPTGTGAWTATAYNALSTISSKTVGSLSLSGTSGYFCAAAFGAAYAKPYGSSVYYAHTGNNTVYAVWLE